MANINSLIGKRLHEARLISGHSQKTLGILAGLDEGVASARINRYEVGVHKPDFSIMLKIAKVLNYPLAYFYCVDDKAAEINLLLHRSTAAKKQLVLKLLLQEELGKS